ncbi:hypothetical protein [Alkalihalobacillus sp. BA299]|uniref:hypothetical protein n=1 Tax=Alkalihalobacillus sp. BA299 TaxID=2815938 RepID=UPI001ADBFEA0|nr:hypothetical protein [Alkalihalobacillus sp. BA299]
MKAETIHPFIDKNTGERFDVGEVYTSPDSKRMEELIERGFLKIIESTEPNRKQTTRKKRGVTNDNSK